MLYNVAGSTHALPFRRQLKLPLVKYYLGKLQGQVCTYPRLGSASTRP